MIAWVSVAQPRHTRAKAAPKGLGNRRRSADRLTFREQPVGRFVQMPLGALSICEMSNQLSGKLVNVDAFEVVELLSLETEDSRATDDRYVDATAVEYFPSTTYLLSRGPAV